MFKNASFYVNYTISSLKGQYRGLMRVSHPDSAHTPFVVLWRVQPATIRPQPRRVRPLHGEARDAGPAARRQHEPHPDNHQQRHRTEGAAI